MAAEKKQKGQQVPLRVLDSNLLAITVNHGDFRVEALRRGVTTTVLILPGRRLGREIIVFCHPNGTSFLRELTTEDCRTFFGTDALGKYEQTTRFVQDLYSMEDDPATT